MSILKQAKYKNFSVIENDTIVDRQLVEKRECRIKIKKRPYKFRLEVVPRLGNYTGEKEVKEIQIKEIWKYGEFSTSQLVVLENQLTVLSCPGWNDYKVWRAAFLFVPYRHNESRILSEDWNETSKYKFEKKAAVSDSGLYTCYKVRESIYVDVEVFLMVLKSAEGAVPVQTFAVSQQVVVENLTVSLYFPEECRTNTSKIQFVSIKRNESEFISDDWLATRNQCTFYKKAGVSDSGRYICLKWNEGTTWKISEVSLMVLRSATVAAPIQSFAVSRMIVDENQLVTLNCLECGKYPSAIDFIPYERDESEYFSWNETIECKFEKYAMLSDSGTYTCLRWHGGKTWKVSEISLMVMLPAFAKPIQSFVISQLVVVENQLAVLCCPECKKYGSRIDFVPYGHNESEVINDKWNETTECKFEKKAVYSNSGKYTCLRFDKKKTWKVLEVFLTVLRSTTDEPMLRLRMNLSEAVTPRQVIMEWSVGNVISSLQRQIILQSYMLSSGGKKDVVTHVNSTEETNGTSAYIIGPRKEENKRYAKLEFRYIGGYNISVRKGPIMTYQELIVVNITFQELLDKVVFRWSLTGTCKHEKPIYSISATHENGLVDQMRSEDRTAEIKITKRPWKFRVEIHPIIGNYTGVKGNAVVQLIERAPEVPPTDVAAHGITHNQVQINFAPIPNIELYGEYVGCKVEVCFWSKALWCVSNNATRGIRSIGFRRLYTETSFQARVACFTNGGMGPWSDWIYFDTLATTTSPTTTVEEIITTNEEDIMTTESKIQVSIAKGSYLMCAVILETAMVILYA
ncbi:unnamed protein product [Cylicocyclus nassatus]|uniref:Ig-like domain-containing protein n=1 Tax=Cylicocyclus nassatus TaxID=53992 RepID=A0AA36GHR3_CYLNA|nr:unnamed protein product [Cylicocyclus nassatus]